MIYIGIGSNLAHEKLGQPCDVCADCVKRLSGHADITVVDVSRWYESAPVPPSDQPWFVNGVVSIKTSLSPEDLMAVLHDMEKSYGRERGDGIPANAARVIDLDIIDYDGICRDEGPGPVLPHPRMDARAFVLLPLADIEPGWVHPKNAKSLDELIKALDPEQAARPISS